MITDDIRDLLHAAPFRPFQVHVTAGPVYRVPHPDYVWLIPGGANLAIASERGSLGVLVNAAHITHVSVEKPARGTGRK